MTNRRNAAPQETADIEQGLANLVVEFGVSVRPDQIVAVDASVGQERLARAVTAAAYQAGARYVEVTYFDPYIRRARLTQGEGKHLTFRPPWLGHRLQALAEADACLIHLTTPTVPSLSAGVDPQRSVLAHDQILPEAMDLVQRGAIAWSMIPGPNSDWARMLRPDQDPKAAEAALWQDVAYVCRLNDPDPIASWRKRVAELRRLAAVANDGQWDAVRFRGPGTDLTVGLFGSSRWSTIEKTTVAGDVFHANLPSEEIFTAPDPARVNGTVVIRRPRLLHDGSRIDELALRFKNGELIEAQGEGDVDAIRKQFARDPGASRLGEVALVAGDTRCAQLNPTGSVLIDENAGCHIAMGASFAYTVGAED